MFKLPNGFDRKYLKICCYAAVTVIAVFCLCMLISYSGGFFIKLWELVSAFLVPMVYGALLNYLLQPVVRKVFTFVAKDGVAPEEDSRAWTASVVLSLLLVFFVIAAIIAVLLVVVTHSLSVLSVDSLMSLVEETQGDLDEFMTIVSDTVGKLGFSTEGLGKNVVNVISGVKDALTTALFSIIFAIYFLLDGNSVVTYGKRVIYALVGDRFESTAEQIFSDANKAFSGYIRGQFVDAVVVGTLVAVMLTIIGVPYGAVVGLLTGIGNLIPYVGGPLGICTVILVCLAQGEYVKLALGIVGIIIVMFLDSNVINPRLLSANVEVHPLLVIAALLAGGAVGGIAGMLVAVPTAAFLKMQVDRWIALREAAAAQELREEPTDRTSDPSEDDQDAESDPDSTDGR